MTDLFDLLALPLLASVLLIGIHCQFSLQVLKRSVVFVDLALAQLDPSGSQHYERLRNAFLARLKLSIPLWQERLAHLNGRPMLVYHNSWPYFSRRFRLNIAAAIEPKPGVAPSPAALARLLRQIRDDQIQVIVREPQEPSRDVNFLAAKTGARVAVLAA